MRPAGGLVTGRKVSKMIHYYGTIADVQNRSDLLLITCTEEVDQILADVGYPNSEFEKSMQFHGLFLAAQDGEITEILAFQGSIPYIWKDLFKIPVQYVQLANH